ncbi:GNAT family N-acetyltransferase [Candidatus Parcubacteria bacterium]|nr:MAG: GNAT family N-acetyltransferase [Candidatus Parcubacteria bacterium]
MIKLIPPDPKYKLSFLEGLQEFQQEERSTELELEDLEKNFQSFVKKQRNRSKGEDLPEGFVPETIYWLMDNDDYVGRVVIRHKMTEILLREGGHIGYAIRPSKRKKGYGKNILKLALEEAKKLGLKKVLLTCNENNIGSKKIIESNGGVFQDRVFLSAEKPYKLRYWIDLT